MLMPAMSAFGFDPFVQLRRLERDMDRLFSSVLGEEEAEFAVPALNVYLGDDKARVVVRLPGVQLEDVDLSTTGNRLTIRGELPGSTARDDAVWLRRERISGPFSRSVDLPFRVEAEKADARFENGLLIIDLPRPEEDRPHRIEIKKVEAK
ncbi:MAG: Hsp20/alpha crystallin family protein [Rhodothalassiaceae bacterium]